MKGSYILLAELVHLYFDGDKDKLNRGIMVAGKSILDHRGYN